MPCFDFCSGLQLGVALSGMSTCTFEQLDAEKSRSAALEVRIADLEKEVGSLKDKEEELEKGLADAEKRASDAEKEITELKGDKERLEKDLAGWSKDAVIAEYKKTNEYDEALANAALPEIVRCWNIAERHIKTDPTANFDSFSGLFVEAKRKIESGLGEPKPYDGPSPSFLPRPDQSAN